mgnify:FL=1
MQGANDLAIFIMMTCTSLSSGLLFTLKGWTLMNELAIPLVLFAGASITWLAWKRRGEPKPA